MCCLGGLDVVCHGDQENVLEAVFRNAARDPTFPGRSMHWVPFPVNRPQAKGIVERHICMVKESFWSIWLGLEVRVGEQLPLGSELFAEAMRYAVRMHNLFHCGKESTTPLRGPFFCARITEPLIGKMLGDSASENTQKPNPALPMPPSRRITHCRHLGRGASPVRHWKVPSTCFQTCLGLALLTWMCLS